ncbi:MAG: proline--tRNA ligase [Proteobacteria bacterium]|nr:proline--tRNA ligase [Pseudomonadota bacterium]
MRLSQYFLPTLKENPVDATVASHQLMIRAGMIRQTASGIYTWLPLGLKVLRKVEQIIRQEMDKTGALEVLMPTIQPAELWQESGRYDAYGKEMLRIKDRHDRDILYGPTHEEVITDIFRKNVTSYKDLPKNFYQIHWKFRDEIRPRFGLMRGREFLMKDSYSFDIDEVSAKKTYNLMYETYFKIFRRMGLKPMAVRADTGAIGGDLSHEFHLLADTGESAIYYDKKFDELTESENFNIEEMQSLYAMADEMHEEAKCPIPVNQLKSRRGIEVGHIFNFGLKYSKALEASVMGITSDKIYPNMGSYGIGVSRVVAAAIEANHDANGIIWPKEIAPFQIALINVRFGDELCEKTCEEIYNKLQAQGLEVIYDDTKASLGQKFSIADLIGIPTQIIVGPKSAAQGKVEIKNRKTGEKKEIRIEEIQNLAK